MSMSVLKRSPHVRLSAWVFKGIWIVRIEKNSWMYANNPEHVELFSIERSFSSSIKDRALRKRNVIRLKQGLLVWWKTPKCMLFLQHVNNDKPYNGITDSRRILNENLWIFYKRPFHFQTFTFSSMLKISYFDQDISEHGPAAELINSPCNVCKTRYFHK